MLEVFNFVCQLAPAAHEFQISLLGLGVWGSLRRNGTFDGFDSEPFRSCRHTRQRAKILDVPVVRAPRGCSCRGAPTWWSNRNERNEYALIPSDPFERVLALRHPPGYSSLHFKGVPGGKPWHCVALPQWKLAERSHEAARSKCRTIIAHRRVPGESDVVQKANKKLARQ